VFDELIRGGELRRVLRPKVEGVARDLMMKQVRRHLKRRLVPMVRLVLLQAESQLSRPQARVLPQAQQVLQQARVLPQARV
jgi:hypothetical protein